FLDHVLGAGVIPAGQAQRETPQGTGVLIVQGTHELGIGLHGTSTPTHAIGEPSVQRQLNQAATSSV
nr:hypothetical protein [Geodermatophilaceae bacterium]